ncbi:MAG: hypothetical protein IT381_13275 [Deltaproteobacteria bacterium]|nr:hypothetical protein [Deltaproteobacteria bacterium]
MPSLPHIARHRSSLLAFGVLSLMACGSAPLSSQKGINSGFSNGDRTGAAGDVPAEEGATGSASPTAGTAAMQIAPLANAGPDQAVIRGSLVKLDARRTFHPLGVDYTWRWSQIGGERTVTLSNADRTASELTSFVAPSIVCTLTFRLVATGTLGEETSDEVTIKVVEQNPFEAPALITSGDVRVPPFADVRLNAFLFGSTLDGNVTWRAVGSNAIGAQSGMWGRFLDVTAPSSGYLFYAVEGSSQGLNSAPAFTVVAVDASASADLSADAGVTMPTELADIIKAPGETVTLVTQQQNEASVWTQLSGEPVVFIDKKSSGWHFVVPSTPQLLWFSFVKDGTSLRSTPLVRAVSVEDPSLDGVVPSAGPDQYAHPGNTITLDAGASVVNQDTSYHWKQSAGVDVLSGVANVDQKIVAFTAPPTLGELVFLLTLGGHTGTSRPDSLVIKVRAANVNDAPTGQVTKMQTGAQSFLVTAEVKDPDSDPITCTWSTTAGSANPTSTMGMQTTFNVTAAPATVKAHCCDALACTDRTATLP